MLALMVSGLLLAIVLTSYKQHRDMSNLLVKAKSYSGPLWRVSGTERQGTIAANLEKQSHRMLLFRLNEKKLDEDLLCTETIIKVHPLVVSCCSSFSEWLPKDHPITLLSSLICLQQSSL